MELRDTISGMISPDYKERLVAEYNQAKIRYDNLKKYVNTRDVSENILGTSLPFEHEVPLTLLNEQLYIMEKYVTILEKRAIICHTEL